MHASPGTGLVPSKRVNSKKVTKTEHNNSNLANNALQSSNVERLPSMFNFN